MKNFLKRIILFFNLPASVLEKWKKRAIKYIQGRLADIGSRLTVGYSGGAIRYYELLRLLLQEADFDITLAFFEF